MAVSIEEQRPAVELTFWRTLYRYLLSIVASLACGAIWYFTGVKYLRLGVLGTIVTGVIALALGFLMIGYLWLAIDVGRPLPDGIDEHQRNTQLFILWMGIPLGVLGVCAIVMVVAVLVAATALHADIPTPR